MDSGLAAKSGKPDIAAPVMTAMGYERSGKGNSLFRRKNSLFREKNSLFFWAQGIGVQAFDLPDRLDAKNAKKGRIRKNSLLNSLVLRESALPPQAYRVIPGPAKPEPGIQGGFASSMPLWIPGSAPARRPGMTQ
jgi:hypothetical protein